MITAKIHRDEKGREVIALFATTPKETEQLAALCGLSCDKKTGKWTAEGLAAEHRGAGVVWVTPASYHEGQPKKAKKPQGSGQKKPQGSGQKKPQGEGQKAGAA